MAQATVAAVGEQVQPHGELTRDYTRDGAPEMSLMTCSPTG